MLLVRLMSCPQLLMKSLRSCEAFSVQEEQETWKHRCLLASWRLKDYRAHIAKPTNTSTSYISSSSGPGNQQGIKRMHAHMHATATIKTPTCFKAWHKPFRMQPNPNTKVVHVHNSNALRQAGAANRQSSRQQIYPQRLKLKAKVEFQSNCRTRRKKYFEVHVYELRQVTPYYLHWQPWQPW